MKIVAMKLILAYGVTEAVAFAQLPTEDTDEVALMFNTSSRLLHSILRSLRGVIIFAVFVCKRNTYKLYTDRFSQMIEMASFSNRNNVNTPVEKEGRPSGCKDGAEIATTWAIDVISNPYNLGCSGEGGGSKTESKPTET